jgi:hypothetical protein
MTRESSPSPTSRTTASPALYACSLPAPAREPCARLALLLRCALADIDRALQVEDLRYIPALMAAIKLSLKFSSKTTIHLATETRFIKVVVCVSILLQLRDLEPVSSATCCVKGRHSAARRWLP